MELSFKNPYSIAVNRLLIILFWLAKIQGSIDARHDLESSCTLNCK
ncbi:MAG: hypothetical protein ACKPKF_06355 [Microcystis panniformis]